MELIVKTTSGCNLCCSYCSMGGSRGRRDLPLEIVEKVLIQLPEVMESERRKNVSFLWHGGEPLLLPVKYYRTFVEMAQKLMKHWHLSFGVQTNGVLINDEWVRFFQEYNVSVGISLDGPAFLHDRHRHGVHGDATHSNVINNIRMLRERGLHPSVLMVAQKGDSQYSEDIYEFFRYEKLKTKIKPLIPSGLAAGKEDRLAAYDYGELLISLFRKWVTDQGEPTPPEPIQSMIEALVSGHRVKECSFNDSCGRDFFCLDETGAVYSCGRFANCEEYCYGSVVENSLASLISCDAAKRLAARHNTRFSPCSECSYYALCRGGCAFEGYLVAGKIEAPTLFCNSYRHWFDFLTTEGLKMLKQRFLKEREVVKARIEQNRKFAEWIKNYEV